MAVLGRTPGSLVERRLGESVDVFSDGFFTVEPSDPGTALAIGPDVVVVVVGRIDELQGVSSLATKDNVAEHVLRRWRRIGPRALHGSSGDFMLLCYDRRSRALSVFRDIVGAVPAYLVSGDRQVVTTSLATALPAATRITPDWRWTQAYLDGAWPEGHLTPYEEIQLLPPGWLATVDEGGAWHTRPLDEWQWVEDVPSDLDESAERFRTLFDNAVARRLVVDGGGTAVTTSGGLDSSSVLVTARHVAPDHRPVALALAFTDRRGDERIYQKAVAAAAGAQLEWVAADATPGPFEGGPAAVIEEHSGPPLVGNWFLQAALRRRAEELGVARVLDGEDGDGVVGASPHYLADLLGRGRVVEWLREVRGVARAFDADAMRVARLSVGHTRAALRAGQLGRSYESSVRGLVSGGYLSLLTAETHRIWAALPAGVAHPFLDRPVMEYALSVPTRQRIHRGCLKVLLRRAMHGRLPGLVATRTGKANISSAFVTALRRDGIDTLREGLILAREALGGLNAGIRPPPQRLDTPQELTAAYRFACVGYWLSLPLLRGAQLSLAPPLEG